MNQTETPRRLMIKIPRWIDHIVEVNKMVYSYIYNKRLPVEVALFLDRPIFIFTIYRLFFLPA